MYKNMQQKTKLLEITIGE